MTKSLIRIGSDRSDFINSVIGYTDGDGLNFCDEIYPAISTSLKIVDEMKQKHTIYDGNAHKGALVCHRCSSDNCFYLIVCASKRDLETVTTTYDIGDHHYIGHIVNWSLLVVAERDLPKIIANYSKAGEWLLINAPDTTLWKCQMAVDPCLVMNILVDAGIDLQALAKETEQVVEEGLRNSPYNPSRYCLKCKAWVRPDGCIHVGSSSVIIGDAHGDD